MKILNLSVIFLLLSCNPETRSDFAGKSDESEILKGIFTAQVNGESYEVAITCYDFYREPLTFKSDVTDVEDSNGDGLVIFGSQHSTGLAFTIMEINSDGTTQYSTTPTTTDWIKKGKVISGTAKLVEGLSNSNFFEDVPFEISCR